MSNPDRLLREAQEHAEALIEDRGLFNALAWAIHCANRTTDGFWSRVVQAIEAIDAIRCDDCGDPIKHDRGICDRCLDKETDAAADRGDFEFHRDHDQ